MTRGWNAVSGRHLRQICPSAPYSVRACVRACVRLSVGTFHSPSYSSPLAHLSVPGVKQCVREARVWCKERARVRIDLLFSFPLQARILSLSLALFPSLSLSAPHSRRPAERPLIRVSWSRTATVHADRDWFMEQNRNGSCRHRLVHGAEPQRFTQTETGSWSRTATVHAV